MFLLRVLDMRGHGKYKNAGNLPTLFIGENVKNTKDENHSNNVKGQTVMRFILLFLFMATLLPAVPAVSAPAPRNDNPEADASCILSIYSLNFGEMLAHPQEDWVIATDQPGVKPDPEMPGHLLHSGDEYVDAYPDGRNISHNPVFGTLQIHQVLSGSFHHSTDSYSWEGGSSGWGSPLLHSELLFRHSGLILCQLHPERQGWGRYEPVSFLSPVWEAHLVAAWKFAQKNPAWFEPVTATGDPQKRTKQVAAAKELLSDNNFVLVAQAVSVLTADGAFDAPSLFAAHALTSHGMRQGLYTALVLLQLNVFKDYSPLVVQAIQAAPDANALAGLALGAYVFTVEYSANGPEESLKLTQALLIKWQVLSGQTQISYKDIHAPGIMDIMPPDEALTYLTEVVQQASL